MPNILFQEHLKFREFSKETKAEAHHEASRNTSPLQKQLTSAETSYLSTLFLGQSVAQTLPSSLTRASKYHQVNFCGDEQESRREEGLRGGELNSYWALLLHYYSILLLFNSHEVVIRDETEWM